LISVPGIVDEEKGQVLFSPNIHWLEKTSLEELIRKIWDLPVVIVQEMRVLAMGEMIRVPERENFLIADVGLGVGVGGAIVINGQLFNHPIPLGGELGHTPVYANQNKCGCGAVGCMETLVSESQLLKALALHEGKKSCTRKDFIANIEQNGIAPWFATTLDSFARVIAGALNVVGVQTFVMTGLLAQLPAVVSEYLFAKVREGTLWARFGSLSCHASPRNRAAGLIAAGLDRLVLPSGDGSRPLARQSQFDNEN
jgi:glucokinase